MTMEIRIGAGDRVEAVLPRYSVATDQDGSAPAPFELFLASIGTCAGFYVSTFCRRRGLDPSAITITQTARTDRSTGALASVEIDVRLPAEFPEGYRDALIRAANLCAVKKAIAAAPPITVVATSAPAATHGA